MNREKLSMIITLQVPTEREGVTFILHLNFIRFRTSLGQRGLKSKHRGRRKVIPPEVEIATSIRCVGREGSEYWWHPKNRLFI